MPSPRKRIGFLPRSEVQEIINTICRNNKLSQSKVTGILVEEALYSRGLLDKLISNFCTNNIKVDDLKDIDKLLSNNLLIKNGKNLNINIGPLKEEVKMINEFIEYKFFKNIMKQSKDNRSNTQ